MVLNGEGHAASDLEALCLFLASNNPVECQATLGISQFIKYCPSLHKLGYHSPPP